MALAVPLRGSRRLVPRARVLDVRHPGTTPKYENKTVGKHPNQDSGTFGFSPRHPIHCVRAITHAPSHWFKWKLSLELLLGVSFVICDFGGHWDLPYRQEPRCHSLFV